jgi:hypothetical protein
MPFYQVDTINQKLGLIQPTDFITQNILERKDFQPLLRDHPQYIDPDLMIVTEEFGDWHGAQRRVDLLGLDKDGNLVVIELKRVDDGSHMELQAIRYAAMLSALDFEAVVTIHEAFLKKHDKDGAAARQALLDFLNPDTPISNKPRIVLISPGFSREITTAVLWLNGIGLDIRCIEVKLYSLQNELYLDMEQIIPLPSAADYQFKIREKSDAIQRSAAQKRGGSSIETLANAGILQPGSRIRMIQPPRPGLPLTDTKVITAKYITGNIFEWEQDSTTYTLSGLTKAVCQHLGGNVGAGVFAGPDFWALEGESTSLYNRARAVATANISSLNSSAS